ncbi:Hsp70 family protein [Domibacillus sp. PGB-M46]|uniref:Hsp70 family protein n=1 Tax=Domibacillus sp. PGB-M46 TaxID=2910255 RepID=UPI001F585365|nr:Hsp70 family protein [Domibacillus sp. PGB-M46]MCI2254783.1 Hsp70 family protein [Domibacillus sp. PGB-M46]
MGLAIGIDLGTSTSAAAVYRRGKVESLPIEGKKIMPSVISCKPDGTTLIGHSAKSRLYIDPLNTISSSKRHMGDEGKTYTVSGRSMTPVDAAKEILSKIKAEAEKYLGESVNDAVITIPAYFTSEQREATKKAGELAGFRVLRLLSEPTAAAIAYGLDKEKDQTIMVYDLGGGTFDISILKVEHNHFDVVAVDGDSLLGGDDFDNKIVQYILRQVSVSQSLQGSQEGSISMQRLKEAVEEAKKELSVSDVADITIPDIFNTHIDEELTIDKFNQMVEPLLKKTTDKMKEVLQAAGLTKRDISRVILVGGSTRMRAVREAVTKEIKQPFIADNVDEIVAHGAAIMAANLSAPEKDMAPVPIEVQEAVPHSFGVGMFLNDVWSVKHLISRNDKLPAMGSTLGLTRYPYQTEVDLPVYRQESIVPDEESFLGKLTISVRAQKEPVALSSIFELDENGILVLSSSELPDYSPIIRQYADTGEVNIPLLRDMIDSKQIQVKSVKIDTTK